MIIGCAEQFDPFGSTVRLLNQPDRQARTDALNKGKTVEILRARRLAQHGTDLGPGGCDPDLLNEPLHFGQSRHYAGDPAVFCNLAAKQRTANSLHKVNPECEAMVFKSGFSTRL